MCGRYVIISKVSEIEKRFNAKAHDPELLIPRVNVGIGQMAPVIAFDKPHEIQFFKFGLTPSWAGKRTYFFNARAEGDLNQNDDPKYTGGAGILQKPAFRKCIRSQRCLVIADAFIEGPRKEKLSKPFVIYMRSGQRPFAMAGIWDEWVDKETGEIEKSFAIVTTAANDLLQRIGHHRGPVILNGEEEAAWLNPQTTLSEITEMLRPFDSERMNAYPISPEIKHPASEGIGLLAPIGQRIVPEYDYEIFSEVKLYGMGESPARERKAGENHLGD